MITSATSIDIFVVDVSGNLTLSGQRTLNFTGASGNISAQAGNSIDGTILAPNLTINNIDGMWYGELIGKGSIQLLSASHINNAPFTRTANSYTPVLIE